MYKKQNVQYYCKFHRLELAVKLITPSFSWGSGISLVFNRSWRDPRPYWRHANKNIFRLKKTADLNNKTSNSRKNQFSKNLSVHERVLKAAAIIYYCHKMAMLPRGEAGYESDFSLFTGCVAAPLDIYCN